MNFNYTSILDRFLRLTSSEGVGFSNIGQHVHIHGSLDDNIVLGVDNLEQLTNNFQVTTSLQRTFVKPFFNEETDKQKIKLAKDIIDNSDIICVYGMALGSTDLTWKNNLVQWLLDSNFHMLFYFTYPLPCISNQNMDEKLDKEDELKESFLRKFDSDNIDNLMSVKNRIHIPVSRDLFDISSIDKIIYIENEKMTS